MAKDDSRLVERCIRKDPLAWAELVKKYTALIDISIENRLKKHSLDFTRADRDDIRQNALVLVWKGGSLASVRNTSDISSWLAMISGNAAIDHMRRKIARDGFRPVSLSDPVGDERAEELIECLSSNAPTPKDEAIRAEMARAVRSALRDLAASERLMVKLSIFHGKTQDEIAHIMRIPVGTVASGIKRAKDELRKYLKKYLQGF